MIRASAKAVAACAALSRAGDDDAIAHGDAADLRSDLDDRADSAVAGDEGLRHVVRSETLVVRRGAAMKSRSSQDSER